MSFVDKFGREVTYLRISVTDKCNLRCIYCMPEEGVKLLPHREILRIEEIVRIAKIFIDHGVKKIRITGGETLVRKGVITLIKELANYMGDRGEVTITTNGTLLEEFGEALVKAGVKRINIGIDSLVPVNFSRMTRRDRFREAIRGVKKALELPFEKVKLNVVVLRNYNFEELEDFLILAREYPLEVRFIEYMPFGNVSSEAKENLFVSGKEIERVILEKMKVEREEEMEGVSRMYRIVGGKGKAGIITPMTAHFCENCNRMRLTANGYLRPCLFSREMIDVKTPLRSGASDGELEKIIEKAVNLKPRINPLLENGETSLPCPMSFIGG